MARFNYFPVDPFELPPVGGSSYYFAVLPTQLDDVHLSPGKLRLQGPQQSSVTYIGSGFGVSVVGGVADVTAGTVTSLTLRYEGRVIAQVKGLKVDAEAMFGFLQVNNYIGYLDLIAKGNDRVVGSALDDSITGWRGNDTMTGGRGSDTVDGYRGKDALYGGSGADTLTGEKGKDILFGGKGADVFVFGAPPGLNNHDVIRDFKPGVDEFYLDDAFFVGIGPAGDLAQQRFRVGNAAQDGDDRIIYQKSTGWLFFDADGSGAGAKVAFARVTAGIDLTASDFEVIG